MMVLVIMVGVPKSKYNLRLDSDAPKAVRQARIRPQNMNAPFAHPFCRLAICRELLSDGNEWSIYAVNDQTNAVDVLVEWATWVLGDNMGHSEEPDSRVTIPSLGVARILRVDGNDAELSMSLSLRLVAGDTEIRLSFELGKLYLYRDPRPLEVLDKVGWLRAADECRRV